MIVNDAAGPHGLTVLRAPGARLCKLVSGDAAPTAAQVPRLYDLYPVAVTTLADLDAILARLAGRPECCIVRAAPLDDSHSRRVRRLLHPDPETGEVPTLRNVPRAWCALDMDGAAQPDGCDPRDLAACHAALVPMLPAELRDAGCVVQATGSHGIKPGLRMRLWFVLDRGCFGADLAPWLAGIPALDMTGFRPVQVHYTATPIFEGRADPLPSRVLLIPGPPAVVPDLARFRRPPALREPAWRRDAPDRPDAAVSRFAALLRTVADAGTSKRHPTLFWAACRAGEMVSQGELGRDEAARMLADAVPDPGGCHREAANLTTARQGIALGMAETR